MLGRPHGGAGTSSVTYTTTIEVSAFFDESLGWHYNLQSAMMIVSFVVMVIACMLSSSTYKAYPESLFQDDGGEGQALGGGQRGGYGGYGGYGGGGQGFGGTRD